MKMMKCQGVATWSFQGNELKRLEAEAKWKIPE